MYRQALTIFLVLSAASALDLQFKKIECDTSLPVYAYQNDIYVECSTEKATGKTRDDPSRCSLGDHALIQGKMHYDGLDMYGLMNSTGYADAELQLMTLEIDLFNQVPFNFCGDWVKTDESNVTCPSDGNYHFKVPYNLPQEFDSTTWFASGWRGVSYLKIHGTRSENSALLAHCKLTFETFVTQSQESGWKTLPSAAQTTLVLLSLMAGMLFIICCLCCKPKQKYAADDAYNAPKDDPITAYRNMEEAREIEEERKKKEGQKSEEVIKKEQKKKQETVEKAISHSMKMQYAQPSSKATPLTKATL